MSSEIFNIAPSLKLGLISKNNAARKNSIAICNCALSLRRVIGETFKNS